MRATAENITKASSSYDADFIIHSHDTPGEKAVPMSCTFNNNAYINAYIT